MKFPSISLGRSTKTYTHNMSFDNSTTLPFGVVQPLLSQRLEANSTINVNLRQLVRLAPMPVPTFARLWMNNEASFVPFVDVCPYYEALISQLSFTGTSKTYYPTKLPVTSSAYLLWFLLTHNDTSFSIYDHNGTPITDHTYIQNVNNILLPQFFGPSAVGTGFRVLELESFLFSAGSRILPSGCDFVFVQNNQSDTANSFTIAFRFGPSVRRLRSVFIGLGYSLNVDNTPVSLLPLLCYYKAWFDLYYPVRALSWTDTNAYKLIKFIEDYVYNFVPSRANGASYQEPCWSAFNQFLQDLTATFYVAHDDIVSVHRDKLSLFNAHTPPVNDYAGSFEDVAQDTNGNLPSIQLGGNLGLNTLQALQRFTRYFNKNSVIGRRISSFIRVHYGADVANSLYKDAFHVHSFRYPLQVDDIFSTSDTFEVGSDNQSKGELLGSYGGKGIGYDTSKVSFKAPSAGYFLVLGSISTDTGYFQGNSGDLYVTDFDTVPSPDFDALGYELTPKGEFYGFNDTYINNTNSANFHNLNQGFGYVPRYTGLKYHKNIVNGDISRLGTSASLAPYHLNRILTPSTVTVKDVNSAGKLTIETHSVDFPGISPVWRYLSSQDWMGNYNRIFYNVGDLYGTHDWRGDFGPDDNFIVQTVFDSKVTNLLKPLSQSFDTFEQETDNGSVDVNPQ